MNVAQYESRLRLLPCVVCLHHTGARTPAQTLHHVGDPATERDDWLQVPICDFHHQGPMGVHGLHRREFERRYRLTDMQMLAIARRLYAQEFGA